jgi:hypothetical protein
MFAKVITQNLQFKSENFHLKYVDWKYLASISSILGFFLLFGGVIAYVYSEQGYNIFGYPIAIRYPYRGYAIPLLILGFSLSVIGLASFVRAEEERKIEIGTPETVARA